MNWIESISCIARARFPVLIVMLLPVMGCKHVDKNKTVGHFTSMNTSETGISFNNAITEDDSINVYYNEYMYNGSGVGIGDFNNDGLTDIFFCGSMVSSKLFINKGNFRFEDITKAAGLSTSEWCTGVSVVDINDDGFSDIYVCASHSKDPVKRKNMLFINDGHLHFSEQAASYGLADTSFSTQAAFFDFDRDGDLDMYLLNHALYSHTANNLLPTDTSGKSAAQDRLYMNDGILHGASHPVFSDITLDAGVKEDGYGLGIAITDVNNDNWPDIYVANDYVSDDRIWLNQKNGRFVNIAGTAMRHESYNSMGVDVADINNDGLPDIGVLDMLPEENERKKTMFTVSSQERYDMERRMGYSPSQVRNMLQLNNGIRNVNALQQPFYSEIGQLAGISETDWSWSILMADFDNDGWKDIHITNGIERDVTNNDYTAFRNAQYANSYQFGGKQEQAPGGADKIKLLRENLDQYGSVRKNNYFFHNSGNLSFSNQTQMAGLAIPSVSNGAAYADLDNDGDLDLVVNNMNEEAFLWRNDTRKLASDTLNNFITIIVKGKNGNRSGQGAMIALYNGDSMQYVEQSPVRGFCSSVDQRPHFGIGASTHVDSIRIVWPDETMQVVANVTANQFLQLTQSEAGPMSNVKMDSDHPALFMDVSESFRGFHHEESRFFDFGFQRGLPQRFSQLGPPIATADVNGDGIDDYFIGGAARQSGVLFIGDANGYFHEKTLVTGNKDQEDLAALFFDADNDHDPDLLVSGGSSEFGNFTQYNRSRLYLNDGNGNFKYDSLAIPASVNVMAATLATADLDGDGDLDLFIGGRLIPQKYPESPRSFILQNDHGRFSDITGSVCKDLLNPGLVTAAVFSDIDNDRHPDLVLCGGWMPVKVFINRNGKLVDESNATGIATILGQWRSLAAADVDGDGDLDLVAGNIGRNNPWRISEEHQLKLYFGDLDDNHSNELISAYFIRSGKGDYSLFPAPDRNQLADQLPSIKKKFLKYADYAQATMQDLLAAFGNKKMSELGCSSTSSMWFENKGDHHFVAHELPVEAQFAPINSIVISDMDGDNIPDMLIAGNEYQNESAIGAFDASYGLWLRGNGKGEFLPVAPRESGFILDGDVKSLAMIKAASGKRFVIAGVNDSDYKVFSINKRIH